MKDGQYEYIHEFKERINETLWLQQKHHDIVKDNLTNPQIQQSSLGELHKLNITLANYFDVAPDIITINHNSNQNGSYISKTSENKSKVSDSTATEEIILV